MTASPAKLGPLRRLLHAPLLHFVLIGGALFAIVRWNQPPTPVWFVRLSGSDVRGLEAGFEGQTGRTPDARERDALIRGEVDDRLLIEEAFALGWHETDGVVVRRLIQNQRFLGVDESVSEAELLARAREQGMDRSDVVVRRRLLERMRLAIADAVGGIEPSRAELEAYRHAHAEAFARRDRTRLTQIFLSRDRRGDALADAADALAGLIAAEAIAPEEAAGRSDPSLLRTDLPLISEDALAREFGAGFAAGATRAPVGRWSGPIESTYGLHFVFVHERTPGTQPPLEEVEAEVRAAWRRASEQQAIRDHVSALRERSRVIVESPMQ
jgi:hypothetical protein